MPRYFEFSFCVVHFGPFGNGQEANNAVDDLLITMLQIGAWCEVMHIGRSEQNSIARPASLSTLRKPLFRYTTDFSLYFLERLVVV